MPAYSTLGRLPAGGWLADPLLNTFIDYPEGELARLVFHELAHQVAFAPGDTLFNESFASAVEKIGAERWLGRARERRRRAPSTTRAEARRADFRALTSRYRDELARALRERRGRRRQARREGRRAGAPARRLRGAEGGALGRLRRLRRAGSREPNNAAFGVLASYTGAGAGVRDACSSAKAATSRASTPRSGALAALPPAERRAALER